MNEPFQYEETTVYQLEQDGWQHGEPLMRNRIWAHVYGNLSSTSPEEREAVARKFAAAEELLEALQMFIAFCNMRRIELGELSDEMENVFSVAQKAKAKALGKETK